MTKRSRKETLLISGILALVLCAAFFDVVFLGKTFKITTANPQAFISGPYGQKNNKPRFFPLQSTDSSIMEESLYEFIGKSLRQGILPLWNPHQGCGFPIIGAMQVGIFFPLNFILYFLPQLFAWDIMIFCRFFLAGLFTYKLMRGLDYEKGPALGAAVAFMLSGPMVLLQWWFANVEIILPLLLLTLENLQKRPNSRNCALAAGATTLTFIAGHPEHVFFVNGFGLLFFCARVFLTKKTSSPQKAFVALMGSYLLGLGLAAFVWMPFLRNMAGNEFWHSHAAGSGPTETPSKFIYLISLALPYFFQKAPVTMSFDCMSWWGGYLGIFPLGLAFLGLFSKKDRGLKYFLLSVILLLFLKTHSNFFLMRWFASLPLFLFICITLLNRSCENCELTSSI